MIAAQLDTIDSTARSWLIAGAILVAALVLSRVVGSIIGSVVGRRSEPVAADLVARLSGYVVIAFGIVYGLDAVGVAIGPLLGALGVIGIALAFALQDLLENFVAGLILQIRRPFTYGDEITSDDVNGVVTRVDTRAVTVETPDGETIEIPSALVIKAPLENHTSRGGRRTDVEVGVAYGTDLTLAKQALVDAVSATPGVRSSPPPEVLMTGFGESSIDLVVRFWHGPKIAERWRVRDAVILAIDNTTKTSGIEIPFPQRVVHHRNTADGDDAPAR